MPGRADGAGGVPVDRVAGRRGEVTPDRRTRWPAGRDNYVPSFMVPDVIGGESDGRLRWLPRQEPLSQHASKQSPRAALSANAVFAQSGCPPRGKGCLRACHHGSGMPEISLAHYFQSSATSHSRVPESPVAGRSSRKFFSFRLTASRTSKRDDAVPHRLSARWYRGGPQAARHLAGIVSMHCAGIAGRIKFTSRMMLR